MKKNHSWSTNIAWLHKCFSCFWNYIIIISRLCWCIILEQHPYVYSFRIWSAHIPQLLDTYRSVNSDTYFSYKKHSQLIFLLYFEKHLNIDFYLTKTFAELPQSPSALSQPKCRASTQEIEEKVQSIPRVSTEIRDISEHGSMNGFIIAAIFYKSWLTVCSMRNELR